MPGKRLIVADDRSYSMDSHKTGLNNNVMVVGTSGSGKTRSIVIPNLLEAEGSYVISDPKGNLYDKYKDYLKTMGYKVKKLDFTDPESSASYNFFKYIRNTQDIIKIAHMLVYQEKNMTHADPFWDQASQLMLQAIIAYLCEAHIENDQNLHNVLLLADMCGEGVGDDGDCRTPADRIFGNHEDKHPDSMAAKYYKRFRCAANRTLKSIIISVQARVGRFDCPEVDKLTREDDIDITSIGREKTALFVVVSDTDRSLDGLINVFFTQAMNEVCRYADKECEENRLPVPVRFIMDDFATNCVIGDFPRMIASIRSRDISVMLMIQAESQLMDRYGEDGKTIIGNCDTYVYLGGNDVETAKSVALRADIPLKKVLNMPVGTNWIFRRGDEPYNGKNYRLEKDSKRKSTFSELCA